jgi:PAS domain S-box-containing protein
MSPGDFMAGKPDPALSSTNIGERFRLVSAQSSEIFRLLVDSVREYAIFVLDPQGHVLTWNAGAEAIKGYSREEIVGHHFSKFYPSEAIESGWPTRELALAQKEGRFSDEGWRVRKDGTVFWASVIITPLYDADRTLTGFAKVTRDMTETRKWEEQAQKLNKELRNRVSQLDHAQRIIELRTFELQELSAQLLQAQDEERRRIARELHDELGQQLAFLGMMIGKSDNAVEAREALQTAVQTVRNLSYLLHPPLLDEVGLRAALEWFIEGLMKRSGLQISLSTTPQQFPRLPKEIEMAIFRVTQESLTNVYRHSGTDSVRVEMERQGDSVILRVRDYGKGLPSDLAAKRIPVNQGVGISGMRERIRQLNGELTVHRAEPGTLVEARIPILGIDLE